MLRLLMDKKNEFIGNAIWTSAKGGAAAAGITAPAGAGQIGAGKEKYFDGVVKRIIDNVNATDAQTVAGGQCIVSGTTELKDGAAVEAALYSMWKKCPKQIRKRSGLSIVMGWEAWDAYDQYITDKMVKYSENSEVNRYRFKGKRIIPITGVPEHTIVMGNFTSGMDSNLWCRLRQRCRSPQSGPPAIQLGTLLLPNANEDGREHRQACRNRRPYGLRQNGITLYRITE